jgi:two-component system, NarL family, sensor histidine kinase DesK
VGAPDGDEERRVRAARRFGRIGLATTVLYLLLAPAPVLLGAVRPGFAFPLLALFAVGLALHLWRVREHVVSLGRRAAPWFVVAASAVGLAISVTGLASGFAGFTWTLLGGVLLGDIVSGRRARVVTTWVASATVLVVVLGVVVTGPAVYGPDEVEQVLRWTSIAVGALYVGGMWVIDVERLWWLKAVTDLDGSRRTAAELAAARERLRLADDLHDILGHALEVVAFKSELAARLLDADPDRARGEMEEVQRVARTSLAEVRSLVHDTRSTDLVTELAGARAVLDSAGIELVVRGDPTTVGPTARNVLGRVLREAMTNVLRHAQPSRCTIEIAVAGGDAVLRVVNDGALPADPVPGSGLTALRRYLGEHRGSLDAGAAPDGTFRLDAVLPGGAR